MKYLFITAMTVFISCAAFSQVYMTRNANIIFFASTPLENIKAENSQVYAVIDAAKKNLAFTLLLKSFLFKKELMQEHFNENYVESDKYPKASFNGSFTPDVDLTKDGVYNVTVKGNLTLHNVTKPVEAPATLEVKDKRLIGKTEFTVKPEDYSISIPALVREKIAQTVTVNVQADCAFLK